MNIYEEQFKGINSIKLLSPDPALFVAPHLCVAQIDFAACKKTRLWLVENLREKGIGTQVHYIPLYRHPSLAIRMGELQDYFPQMETYYSQALSLPLYYDLSEAQAKKIAQEIKHLLLE